MSACFSGCVLRPGSDSAARSRRRRNRKPAIHAHARIFATPQPRTPCPSPFEPLVRALPAASRGFNCASPLANPQNTSPPCGPHTAKGARRRDKKKSSFLRPPLSDSFRNLARRKFRCQIQKAPGGGARVRAAAARCPLAGRAPPQQTAAAAAGQTTRLRATRGAQHGCATSGSSLAPCELLRPKSRHSIRATRCSNAFCVFTRTR